MLKSSFSTAVLLSTLLLFQIPAAAQNRGAAIISGTVTDAETGIPLAGAHVFIAVSMIGTTTDLEGHYSLENIPLGAQRLYVSMLGFEPQSEDLNLRESRVYPIDFKLEPAILEAGEITVEAKGDKNWKSRLEKFTRYFIGETPNSEATKISNPEVLDFEEKMGHLTAYNGEQLIIENEALGYRIQYFLKDFSYQSGRTQYDGEPLYEELEPNGPQQAGEWKKNRISAFKGSPRHFMLATLAGRTERQGFKVYNRPSMGKPQGGGTMQQSSLSGNERFPVDPNTLLKPGEIPAEKILEFEGFLEIVYMGEMEDPSYLEWSGGRRGKPKYQTSWINLEHGPTVVDYKGDIIDPYGLTYYGYWAFERVGDELPKEYRPNR